MGIDNLPLLFPYEQGEDILSTPASDTTPPASPVDPVEPVEPEEGDDLEKEGADDVEPDEGADDDDTADTSERQDIPAPDEVREEAADGD